MACGQNTQSHLAVVSGIHIQKVEAQIARRETQSKITPLRSKEETIVPLANFIQEFNNKHKIRETNYKSPSSRRPRVVGVRGLTAHRG